jgi:hypothetical protein
MKATNIGNLKCEVTQPSGEKFTVILDGVNYVPNLCIIFSLKKALKKGFKVSNDDFIVILIYKHVKLTFVRVNNATDGFVTLVLMKPIMSNNINGFANESIIDERTYDINYLYKIFGSCGQETLRTIIKLYGFKSSGKIETCKQCAIATALQKTRKRMFRFKQCARKTS